jgi:uncharacterized protein YqjF (DUF2071 family)
MRIRPKTKNAGTQVWNDLLFLHWEIPISIAQSLIPANMSIDLYDGKAWIGLVPFAMEGVRPSWLPKWAAFSFLESNVRLYVQHNGEAGVFFLSLDAASWLAVQAARIGWNLPYFYAHMSIKKEGNNIQYRSKRPSGEASLSLSYTIKEQLGESIIGSPEFFFLERYLLFAERNGHVYRGQVYHTPYPTHRATLHHIEETILHTHGIQSTGEPAFIHASPGVTVEVFALTKTTSLLINKS